MGDDGKPLVLRYLDWIEKLSNEELREVLKHLTY